MSILSEKLNMRTIKSYNNFDTIYAELPFFVFQIIDGMGDDKKLKINQAVDIILNKIYQKYNISFVDFKAFDSRAVPIIKSILESVNQERIENKKSPKFINPLSRKAKKVKQPSPFTGGVPPIRYYKTGELVERKVLGHVAKPSPMLRKLLINGIGLDACDSAKLPTDVMRKRFRKLIRSDKPVANNLLIKLKLEPSSTLMRKVHNDAKYELIKKVVTRKDAYVLDVGAGTGGDIHKWKSMNVRLTMVEPNRGSLLECKERVNKIYPFCYSKMDNDKYKTRVLWGDIITTTELDDVNEMFEYVCYNFSLQYCFRTKTYAYRTIKRIADKLVTGGVFFGIIPNFDKYSKFVGTATQVTDDIGNYMVLKNSYSKNNINGEKVAFYMKDAPYYEEGAVEEPIISANILANICAEYGLEMVFIKDMLPIKTGLLSDYYSSFAFRKRSKEKLDEILPADINPNQYNALYDVAEEIVNNLGVVPNNLDELVIMHYEKELMDVYYNTDKYKNIIAKPISKRTASDIKYLGDKQEDLQKSRKILENLRLVLLRITSELKDKYEGKLSKKYGPKIIPKSSPKPISGSPVYAIRLKGSSDLKRSISPKRKSPKRDTSPKSNSPKRKSPKLRKKRVPKRNSSPKRSISPKSGTNYVSPVYTIRMKSSSKFF